MNATRESRLERRYLTETSRQYPAVLAEVPRHEWPREMPPGLERVLRSSTFLVQVYVPKFGARRLSICRTAFGKLRRMGAERNDWAEGITWDDLQRLKREAGYGDQLAVEIFPPDADVVNVANMRHLWILDEPLEFAWQKRSNG